MSRAIRFSASGDPGVLELTDVPNPEPGIDAVLDASGRGELAASVKPAGGPERVLTIAASDAEEHGVRFSGGDGEVDVSDAFPEIVLLP